MVERTLGLLFLLYSLYAIYIMIYVCSCLLFIIVGKLIHYCFNINRRLLITFENRFDNTAPLFFVGAIIEKIILIIMLGDGDPRGEGRGGGYTPPGGDSSQRDPLVDGADSGNLLSDSGISHRHFAVRLRHSLLYVFYIIIMLVLTTALLVWVIVEGSFPKSSAFVVIEVIVTIAIFLDLVVEVRLQGSSNFFVGASHHSSGGSLAVRSSSQGPCGTCLNKYGQLVWNWTHTVITILCLVAMVVAIRNSGSDEEEGEAEFSLVLLIIRYVFYVVFLIGSQMKSIQMQGGLRNPFRGNGPTNDDAWDVRFED